MEGTFTNVLFLLFNYINVVLFLICFLFSIFVQKIYRKYFIAFPHKYLNTGNRLKI